MTTPPVGAAGKTEAQRRADRIRAFRQELSQLREEAALVLTPEQQERLQVHHDGLLADLARRFDVDVSEAQQQMSLGMRIASFLGALALAAAVYFFFYKIWGRLDTPVQVGLLVAAPLLACAGVELAARRERTLYVASVMAILALACFVLNLNVLGAIFNITPTQHALLVWGALGALLAFGYGLRLQMAGALVFLIGWIAATLGVFSGMDWSTFWRRPESTLLAGAVVFSVPFAWKRMRRDFHTVHRLIGLLAVLISVLILGFDGDDSWLPGHPETLENLYQVAGFIISSAAIWLGVRRGWIELVRTGGTGFVIFLFVKFFDWWWDWMPKYLFFLILGAVAVGILLVLRRFRTRLVRASS